MSEAVKKKIAPRDEETERRLVEEMVRKICIFDSEEHLRDFLEELASHRTRNDG